MHITGFEAAWEEFSEKSRAAQGVMTREEMDDFEGLMAYQATAFCAGWAARDVATMSCRHCLYTDRITHFIHAHGEMICSQNPGKYGMACPHCGWDQA